MSAEMPYPGIGERMVRVEDRQDRIESAVTSLHATSAVHTEQIADMQGDVKDIAQTFKEASASTNMRIDRLIKAVWAAVAVLLPIAAALMMWAFQNGGG